MGEYVTVIAARSTKLACGAQTLALVPRPSFMLLPRQPLHVTRLVPAALPQRNDVIHLALVAAMRLRMRALAPGDSALLRLQVCSVRNPPRLPLGCLERCL